MKIFVSNTNFHFKNKNFIDYFIDNHHERVFSIDQADIIYSPNIYIDIHKYPQKKFIFGPHFSVFPNSIVQKFNNIHGNGIYIQPSQPSVNSWQNEFNFNKLPMYSIPFGVDTEKFKPCVDRGARENVIVYYKSRDPNEYEILILFLKKRNIQYKVFNYQTKYNENEFISYLKTCKYGIVLGRHESQGFAIQEMLSLDIPLFVWGVSLRKQEYPYISQYVHVKSIVSTVPYWSKNCGELIYNVSDLDTAFDLFLKKLNHYQPRKFILENVSRVKCCEKWNELLHKL